MSILHPSFMLFAACVFLLTLLMNLVRKNTSLVMLYLVQSLAVTCALLVLAQSESAAGLLVAAILTLAVKVAMAPAYLLRLIRQYSAHFSAASYLSTPLTLLALASATAFSYSFISPALAKYNTSATLPLLFASVFGALVLMINRRGALAAVVGILSLENAVVLLAAYLGVEHSYALELAIAFDIAVWIAIAAAFLTMMHRQFGTVDNATRRMTHLTEE